jgi:hypothetical protein
MREIKKIYRTSPTKDAVGFKIFYNDFIMKKLFIVVNASLAVGLIMLATYVCHSG